MFSSLFPFRTAQEKFLFLTQWVLVCLDFLSIIEFDFSTFFSSVFMWISNLFLFRRCYDWFIVSFLQTPRERENAKIRRNMHYNFHFSLIDKILFASDEWRSTNSGFVGTRVFFGQYRILMNWTRRSRWKNWVERFETSKIS